MISGRPIPLFQHSVVDLVDIFYIRTVTYIFQKKIDQTFSTKKSLVFKAITSNASTYFSLFFGCNLRQQADIN